MIVEGSKGDRLDMEKHGFEVPSSVRTLSRILRPNRAVGSVATRRRRTAGGRNNGGFGKVEIFARHREATVENGISGEVV